jgi:ABC-type transport system involved in multi-copper enzyme maturation permease subunit
VFGPPGLLAEGVYDLVFRNAGLFAAVVVVIFGVVIGIGDLVRLSPTRVFAISGVVVADAVRRRVLWIAPVAIVGILAVSQFLNPIDPQDAIRQTTKVCLFATGLIVTITAIILACTNLPKEIDNRVIYTIVTKPTSRLEIVLGKVLGFARVSALLLLIMGVFTYGYLLFREWRMRSWVREQLVAHPNDPVLQPYAKANLLSTRSLEQPDRAEMYGRPPAPDGTAVLMGGESQYFMVPFQLSAQQKDAIVSAVNGGGALFVVNKIGYEQRLPTPEEARQIRDLRLPVVEAGRSPSDGGLLPALPSPVSVPIPIPQISMKLYDKNLNPLVEGREVVNEGKPVQLPPDGDAPSPTMAIVSPEGVQGIVTADRVIVLVEALTQTVMYEVGLTPTVLAVATAPGAPMTEIGPVTLPDGKPQRPTFESHRGRYGMQFRGKADGSGPLAAFAFSGAQTPRTADGKAPVQVKIGIESAGDFEIEGNITPVLTLQVRNRKTGKTSDPMQVRVESGRVIESRVPVEFVEGGDFDVYVRGLNEGTWYGIEAQSLNVVTAERSFATNLFKSLFILWLMAILVVVISVFCSTFLSWPIAVVLTLMMLLGHWGVSQLGTASGSGLGAEVTQAMGVDNPTGARVLRESVDMLTTLLNFLAQFLPDIGKFAATEDIERGISIPWSKIGAAGWVLLGYGLPVLLLSYVIFRRKEVAP